MHHHSTKQRLAALRRRFGIQLTPPGDRAGRSPKIKAAADAVRAAHEEASGAMRAAREASRRIVAALTPAPILATAQSLDTAPDLSTAIAPAPYPAPFISTPDAVRDRRDLDDLGAARTGGRLLQLGLLLVLSLMLVGFGLYGLWEKQESLAETTPAGEPSQAVARAPSARALAAPASALAAAPATAPAPRRLTVAKGDCLWRLSAAHLGDPEAWPRLFAANRAAIRDPNVIHPGQTLQLP